jgi:hypothetical protein
VRQHCGRPRAFQPAIHRVSSQPTSFLRKRLFSSRGKSAGELLPAGHFRRAAALVPLSRRALGTLPSMQPPKAIIAQYQRAALSADRREAVGVAPAIRGNRLENARLAWARRRRETRNRIREPAVFAGSLGHR